MACGMPALKMEPRECGAEQALSARICGAGSVRLQGRNWTTVDLPAQRHNLQTTPPASRRRSMRGEEILRGGSREALATPPRLDRSCLAVATPGRRRGLPDGAAIQRMCTAPLLEAPPLGSEEGPKASTPEALCARIVCSDGVAPTVRSWTTVAAPTRVRMPSESIGPAAAHPQVVPAPKRSSEVALARAMAPAALLDAGQGGIEELARRVDESMVTWALLTLELGSGSTACNKLVAIHCDGKDTPVTVRDWLNARKQEPLNLFGEVDAVVRVTSAEELTMDVLLQHLPPVPCEPDDVAVAEAPHKVSAEEALRAVGTSSNGFNWALLEPSHLELHHSGCGGIEELVGHLPEDKVLFGVLRICFDCRERGGHLTRFALPHLTRYVFVHWVGPRVSAVQRGRWNARLREALAMVGAHCTVAFRREVHSVEELRLGGLLADLRRFSAADAGMADSPDEGRTPMQAQDAEGAQEDFVGSCPEANGCSAEVEGQPELQELELQRELQPLPELEAVVAAIREATSGWRWALCGWRGAEATEARAGAARATASAALAAEA